MIINMDTYFTYCIELHMPGGGISWRQEFLHINFLHFLISRAQICKKKKHTFKREQN